MHAQPARWHCNHCGALVEVPAGRRPQVMLSGASGRQSVRILSVDQRELHRCTFPYAPHKQ